MENFISYEPKTLQEALALMQTHRGQKLALMAGATDLIPPLRAGAMAVDVMIDIMHLGLNTIEETEDRIVIGATCTMKEVYTNPLIRKTLPVLADACRSIGAVQTRGLATIGGNSCVALPSLDSAPALFIYNADYVLESLEGSRTVNVRDFFTGPRRTVIRKNEEILTAISVPKPDRDFVGCFFKFGRREALTLSIVNCALGARIENGRMYDVKTCVGACAPTPVTIPALEEYVNGKSLSEIDEETVESLVRAGIRPISDIRASAEYRYILAGKMAVKGLRKINGIKEETE